MAARGLGKGLDSLIPNALGETKTKKEAVAKAKSEATTEEKEPLIILLNDNGMSIGQNVGGVASHLARIRTRPGYYQFKKCYHNMMHHLPGGRAVYHGVRADIVPAAARTDDDGP